MNRRQFLGTMMAAGASLAFAAPAVRAARLDQPAAAADGKTLIIGSVEEPDTLNVFVSLMFTTGKVMSGVMSPLVNFDTKLNFVPALAESWKISEDGKTYTFKLRKGVKWHDGQPFTAADVVATHKMIMDPKFGAPSTLGWDQIESMATPNDHTLVVKLKASYMPFLAWVGPIGPKHLIDKGLDAFKQTFGRNPIGTGAFKFVKWDSGQQIVLEKNPNFFGGAPKIDKIVFKIVPDTNTLIAQLKTGEVQMTDALGTIDFDAVKNLPGLTAQGFVGLAWTHINLKNIDHLLDKRVRQALDFATPRQQIVDQLLKGLAEVSIGDQSPITPYFNPNIKARPYDLNKAAGLLKDAGFKKNSAGVWEKDGKPLRIEYWIGTGDTEAKLVSQVVTASWRKLGVDVEENEQDIRMWSTADGFPFRKAMTAGQFQWFMAADPEDSFLWNSSAIPKEAGGAGTNFPPFFNKLAQQAKLDELTTAGAQEVNPAKRKQIYWQLQELLHEEVPVIFLYWPKRVYVAPKNLKYTTSAAMPLLFNAETWSFTS